MESEGEKGGRREEEIHLKEEWEEAGEERWQERIKEGKNKIREKNAGDRDSKKEKIKSWLRGQMGERGAGGKRIKGVREKGEG